MPRMLSRPAIWLCLLLSTAATLRADQPGSDAFAPLAAEYADPVRSLVKTYCLECHSTAAQEGELDLEVFAGLPDVRQNVKVWLKVAQMLDEEQMPPKDAPQPPAAERRQLRDWVGRYLKAEAYASAGDPGPVVLRRLNNAQYTFTVGDLTGVPLNPAREFPLDSAAGEGFTNAGSALVMSPALLNKYLAASKDIAEHAVLLPDGFRFSPSTTRRDHTNEILAQIRQMYLSYSEHGGGTKVNLHGLTWETDKGGRLAIDKYLAATLAEREAIRSGAKSIDAIAGQHGVNARYLGSLWQMLNGPATTPLLEMVRTQWRDAKPENAAAIAAQIGAWQEALVRFQSVGHMKSWMAPVNPLLTRQEIRYKIPAPASGNEITLYLATTSADAPRTPPPCGSSRG